MDFHFDWLTVEQDFGFVIPDNVIRKFCDFGTVGIHLDTGELQEGIKVPTYIRSSEWKAIRAVGERLKIFSALQRLMVALPVLIIF